MIIDCDTCIVRGPACSDCVVTFVLGPPGWIQGGFEGAELTALAVLAGSGLVPPLRLVTSLSAAAAPLGTAARVAG
ncbi:MAG: hypothetical protein WCI29_04370 [Actinomycetes bacterium]